MPSSSTITGNWYDYPQYYDVAFRGETRIEANFVEQACQKYLPKLRRGYSGKRRLRLLEPACGSGRLVAELARRGHDVAGYDLSPAMVDYVQHRLRRHRLEADVVPGDMSDFRLPKPADAAFNFVNTFRHLTRPQAEQHLDAVADSLKPGGIYLLGIILIPEDTDESEAFERWTVKYRSIKVTVTITVPTIDIPNRWEIMRTAMSVRHGRKSLRLVSDSRMELYTPADLRELIARTNRFDVIDAYDFWYDIKDPLPFDDRIGDVLLVLRRRAEKMDRADGPSANRGPRVHHHGSANGHSSVHATNGSRKR